MRRLLPLAVASALIGCQSPTTPTTPTAGSTALPVLSEEPGVVHASAKPALPWVVYEHAEHGRITIWGGTGYGDPVPWVDSEQLGTDGMTVRIVLSSTMGNRRIERTYWTWRDYEDTDGHEHLIDEDTDPVLLANGGQYLFEGTFVFPGCDHLPAGQEIQLVHRFNDRDGPEFFVGVAVPVNHLTLGRNCD